MPGVPVYSLLLVCVLPIQSAHETAGAAGTRHSPRPPKGARDKCITRAHRAARFKRMSSDRHCEPTGLANARPMTGSAKQSILSLRGEMDCFASLAMTVRLFEIRI